MSEYDEKNARSFKIEDLERIVAVSKMLKNVTNIQLDDLSVKPLDETATYNIGEVWWDPELEMLMWDPKEYGNA